MFNFFNRNKKEDLPKIGDIVICIDDRDRDNSASTIPLVYKKSYKIVDIINDCSHTCYDIGSRIKNNTKTHTRCMYCNVSISGKGIHWARANRFRKATPEEIEEFRLAEKEVDIEQIKFNESLEKLINETIN